MYIEKVARLSFWAEMDEIVNLGNHTSIFSSLDILSEMPKEARKRSGNPIYNIRKGKKQKKKELSKYFSRISGKN